MHNTLSDSISKVKCYFLGWSWLGTYSLFFATAWCGRDSLRCGTEMPECPELKQIAKTCVCKTQVLFCQQTLANLVMGIDKSLGWIHAIQIHPGNIYKSDWSLTLIEAWYADSKLSVNYSCYHKEKK